MRAAGAHARGPAAAAASLTAGAARAQAQFTASEEAAPVLSGKRLTVNFAKARP